VKKDGRGKSEEGSTKLGVGRFFVSPPFLPRRVYPDFSEGVRRIVGGKGWFGTFDV